MSRRPHFEVASGEDGDLEETSPDSVATQGNVAEEDPYDPTWQNLYDLVVNLNEESMECLKGGHHDQAYEKLMRAQDTLALCEQSCPSDALSDLSCTRASVAGTFAIYYKRIGNQPMTVRFLETALSLYEASGADFRTLMAAHLNLSASFSEAELFDESLQHALSAVTLGGQLIASGSLPRDPPGASDAEARSTAHRGSEEEDSPSHPGAPTVRPDDYAMLAVAYHKTAEAHEHMKQWGQATLAYTQA